MESTSFATQLDLVFRRTARDAGRNFALAFVAPTLLAGFIAVIFAAAFNAIGDTPGFPADSFLDWVAPGTVLLTAFVGAGYAAGALLRDIETGYLDRMRLLAVRPSAIIIGRAGFEAVRVLPPAVLVLAVSLVLGVGNANGPLGFVAVIAVAALLALTWNGIFFMVAMTSRSQQAVLGLQPLFMPVIMFSTFFAPTDGAPGWFDAVATANPFTHVLDGTRGVLFGSTDSTRFVVGLAAFVALGAVTYGLAARAYDQQHRGGPDRSTPAKAPLVDPSVP